ncbi:MAG: peptidylprolyl isomerase [Desulfotomaculaceae bacterium]
METQKVLVNTAKGDIELELHPYKMPITVENFLKLTDSGFYDGLVFHRVEDWVVQGGDPKGNGTGGPGWSIKLETHPGLNNVRGALAMARSANPDSAGSQFYILKTDASWLDGQYAVFGMVTSGMDVVDKMEIGDKINTVKRA